MCRRFETTILWYCGENPPGGAFVHRLRGMSEAIRNLILDVLDIRKLRSLCNAPKCRNRTENEVFIYQYTTQRKIGLATLYLCGKHLNITKDLLKKIKAAVPDKIIQSHIGRVAQN